MTNRHNWRVAIFFAVIMMLTLPVISYAQGRGNGNGRGRGRSTNWKCGKFVNCHDARDGRLDNRGPRGSRIGRHINRDDRGGIFRNRRLDRDGDGDFDRNDRILRRQQNTRWQIRNTRRNGRFNR